MALPFLNGASKKKRNQIVAIDLGTRATKAVVLERRNEALALTGFAVVDAPISDKKISTDALTDHLRAVMDALGGGVTKSVAVSINADEALVRTVELPPIPGNDMRQLLKMNSKAILQQELPGYTYDFHIFPPKTPAASADKKADAKQPAVSKLKVLVAAAKQQLLDEYKRAIVQAGLSPEAIIPGLIGPLNTFELALPQVYENESVAVVDIGFRHSSICLLDRGELILSRGVNIGGDQLTTGLAEAMNISYAEAEGIKVGLAPEAQAVLQSQVFPLGRELRASIDFYEHQQDRAVSQVYVCGAAARSEMFLEMLHAEMIVECKAWNPTTFLQMALPQQQATEIEQMGPQLTVAIGAGVAVM
jgi:type IV pilus assembly protein PilM